MRKICVCALCKATVRYMHIRICMMNGTGLILLFLLGWQGLAI
jgi:hypothetical protein